VKPADDMVVVPAGWPPRCRPACNEPPVAMVRITVWPPLVVVMAAGWLPAVRKPYELPEFDVVAVAPEDAAENGGVFGGVLAGALRPA
jgi:hypothetical protein